MEDQKVVIPKGIVLKKPLIGEKPIKKYIMREAPAFTALSEEDKSKAKIVSQKEVKTAQFSDSKLEKDSEVITIDISEKLNSEAMKKVVLPFPSALKKTIASEVVLGNPVARAAANDNPNGAYTIAYDTLYSDAIGAPGDQRWYNFELTAQKKLTVYMSPVADTTIDNDLQLYKLDTATYMLNLVSESKNYAGIYEQLSYVAEPGIYYVCVAAYQCSAANQFSFFVRQTDTWDTSEADDSLALAKEQPIGKIIRRTLDNSVDEDCTILLVPTAGTYHIKLMDVPANCNYQLQVLSANQMPLATISKNTQVNLSGFSAGGYFLKVLAPDGVVDPAANYTVFITPIPAALADANRYKCRLTNDRTHFIEEMLYPATTGKSNPDKWVIYVDGALLDIYNLDITTGGGTGMYFKHNCSGISSSSSYKVELLIGSYGGRLGSPRNALLINMANAIYGFYHSETMPNYLPDVWSDVWSGVPVWFIYDLDERRVCDTMFPNWFYGTPDSYPKGVGQESASFSSINGDYISVSAGNQPI